MSERQPRKSGLSPSPFNLALLLVTIALGTLAVVLLSSGMVGNFFSPQSPVKQAQAVESPTSGVTEPTPEVPTSDPVETDEGTTTPDPSATLLVTETATFEISATPTETETSVVEPTAISTEEPTSEPSATLLIETPTAFIEPTNTEIPPTQTPTNEPPNTPKPFPTKELPTNTPETEKGTILFESGGALNAQPVDAHGKANGVATQLLINAPAESRIGDFVASPNGQRAFFPLFSQPQCDDCEGGVTLNLIDLSSGQVKEFEPPARKLFGWHPNGQELIFGNEGGTVGLYDVETKTSRFVAKVQDWLNVPWEPIIHGIAFSPDGKQLIVSFGLPGEGIGYQAWLADADGANAYLAIESKSPIFEFAWSPNSEKIAFISNGLGVMRRDGQERQIISKNFSVGWGFHPRWSPNNRYIAFEAYEELPTYPNLQDEVQKVYQYHKIHIYDLEARTERRLIQDESGGEIQPTWSPDSQRISFLSNRNGTTEVWISDLEGKTVEQLTADGQPKRATMTWLNLSVR